ncbi:Tudor domain [Desmophyllum pertusum]|uniref:RNA helicase n=1 Tax=Desmophyllum pertusum TaxID=174260 RepID=A0A9W9Z3I0_9CNID|nr:Tudor domain [Desmophyllum pertusum]
MLAYLVPIIYQLVEERQLYADLPKSANGPQLLVLAPTWVTVVSIYKQCRYILERQRNIRVQPIFAAGAEENQVLPVVNGCEILIATPSCFPSDAQERATSPLTDCATLFFTTLISWWRTSLQSLKRS